MKCELLLAETVNKYFLTLSNDTVGSFGCSIEVQNDN